MSEDTRPNIKRIVSTLVGLLLTGALGCSGAQAPAETEGGIHRTVVHIDEDGVANVTVQKITRAEQEAEIAAREAMTQSSPGHREVMSPGQAASSGDVGLHRSAINVDTGCAGSSLWMFDDYALTGNELCLYWHGVGNRYENLADFGRWVPMGRYYYLGNWDHAVRSFWAGDEYGMFRYEPVLYPYFFWFNVYQRVDYADVIVANALGVYLGVQY